MILHAAEDFSRLIDEIAVLALSGTDSRARLRTFSSPLTDTLRLRFAK